MKPKPKKKPTPLLVAGVHFIGEWIAALGHTQEDVAEKIGVNKSTVSRWCAGGLPELDNVLKIADVLGREPNDLFHHPKEVWLLETYRSKDDKDKKRLEIAVSNTFPD